MAITQLQPFNLDSTANYTFANVTATNANLGNAATANFFIGSGNNLSNIQVANVSGIGNIATTNYNGNGSQVLAGNGAWVNSSGGGTSAAAAVGYSLIFGG